jgi:cell division protein FtsL
MRMLALFIGLCLVFLFVWERVDIVRVGYRVERLKVEKTKLERERDQLRVKVSSLSAPDRIAKVATEQLGMVPPQKGQVIMVQSRPAGESHPHAASAEVRIARNDLSDGRR